MLLFSPSTDLFFPLPATTSFHEHLFVAKTPFVYIVQFVKAKLEHTKALKESYFIILQYECGNYDMLVGPSANRGKYESQLVARIVVDSRSRLF